MSPVADIRVSLKTALAGYSPAFNVTGYAFDDADALTRVKSQPIQARSAFVSPALQPFPTIDLATSIRMTIGLPAATQGATDCDTYLDALRAYLESTCGCITTIDENICRGRLAGDNAIMTYILNSFWGA